MDLPVYFPFTFLEPERVARLYDLVGTFRVYRIFEKKVSDEISDYASDGKIICDLFRLSSDNSVKIAHRFLDWSKNTESLDLKTVAAFFNYMDASNESVDIIGSMESIDNDSSVASLFNDDLLKHEITLFFIQLLDRQEYEINGAFRRISQTHKRLFMEPEKLNIDMPSQAPSDLSAYRLSNMNSRVVSWLAAFFFLSEQTKIIFTDEKEAFMVFMELLNSHDVKLYRANVEKSGLCRSELMSIMYSAIKEEKYDSELLEVLENGKQVIEKPGDLFFAVPDRTSFVKTIAGVLGVRSESMIEYSLLSRSCISMVFCLVI